MPHVTDYYGIPEPVPFLNVDVDHDKPMFVDPRSVRLQAGPAPYVDQANHNTRTFFHEIARCALSSNAADQRRGLDLLQHFEEPRETRLGYAAAGFSGHGGAAEVGTWIWEALTTELEALLRVGILTQIEDLPLFVEGLAEDITSDLTTRIIFEPLSKFTASMVAAYPQFTANGHTTVEVERQVWDSTRLQWTTKEVVLPDANGHPLLLVPRDWARPSLLMSAGRYYETKVLGYAQLEQAVVSRDTGRLIKTPKPQLAQQDGLGRGRGTNLAVTERAQAENEDLVATFKAYVDNKYEPVPDDRIEGKLA